MFCQTTNINTMVFYTLLFIGITSGIYHGIFNNNIYHDSAPNKNIHERVHTIWIHFIGGLVGSVCLYLLFNKYFLLHDLSFQTGDIIFLFVGLIGIVGLLPMTLWFLVLSTNSLGKSFFDLFKKVLH